MRKIYKFDLPDLICLPLFLLAVVVYFSLCTLIGEELTTKIFLTFVVMFIWFPMMILTIENTGGDNEC